jgi:cell division protein FtsL
MAIPPVTQYALPAQYIILISLLLFQSSLLAETQCTQTANADKIINKLPEFENIAPRIAFIIGNSNYINLDTTPNAENDARDIAAVLNHLGFEVICGIDVNREEFMTKLKHFRRRLNDMGKNTVSLFYYAGHGIQINNNNYIIPLGANVDAPAMLGSEAINLDLILGRIANASNIHGSNLIFLDACRNNPLGEGWAKPKTRFNIKNLFWAYGTGYGQFAFDGKGRNGLFTKHILNNIHHKGITIDQLLKKVTAAVAHESGNKQIPEVGGSLVQDFMFLPGERKTIVTTYEDTPLWEKVLYYAAAVLALILSVLYYLHLQKTAWTKGIDLTDKLIIDPKVAEEVRQKSRLTTDEIKGYVKNVKDQKLMALVTPKYDMILGRDKNVNIVCSNDSISGQHAQLGWDKEEEEFWLEDLNSTNGTWWGKGKKLNAGERYLLESGQIFYLADQETPIVVIAHMDKKNK